MEEAETWRHGLRSAHHMEKLLRARAVSDREVYSVAIDLHVSGFAEMAAWNVMKAEAYLAEDGQRDWELDEVKAELFLIQARHDEAFQLLEQTLLEQERALGIGHIRTVTSLH